MGTTIERADVQLKRHVLEELEWEPSVDAAQIGVTTREGIVTLTGHVPVYSEKHTAEEAIKRVHGVRAVANEIEVRPSDAHVRDDEEIAAAAVHALQWDAKVPDTSVQISVEEGWITADGTVEHSFQKAAIDRVLRHLHGVRGVTNDVTVHPRQTSSSAKYAIESALRRNAILRCRNLDVEVERETVTITGDVHSLNEFAEVERTVWSAGGVRHVQNCVTITPWGCGPAEEWGY